MSPQRRDELRAADVDRTFVADLLKQAVDEGRLTLTEYDDRLKRTYEARTYGELDNVIGDLPRPRKAPLVPAAMPAPMPALGPTAPADRPSGRGWLTHVWFAWFLAVGINTVVWLIVSVTTGNLIYPWPLWVAGPWGVVLLASTLAGRDRRNR